MQTINLMGLIPLGLGRLFFATTTVNILNFIVSLKVYKNVGIIHLMN